MDTTLLLLVAGAFAGGFVNGLAGFGTALFALGFWLQVLPPMHAVALVLTASTATGLQGLWVVRTQMTNNLPRLARFLIPGVLGIPIGITLLSWIDPKSLKLIIAAFLIAYGLFFILRGKLPSFDRITKKSDAVVGFLGGILGGLAGLSGALPAMWCALRPWPRHETRSVLQPYNFVILTVSLITLAVQGAFTPAVLRDIVIALPVSIVAAVLGILVFRRISDIQFRWLLIALMLVSGLALGARELF